MIFRFYFQVIVGAICLIGILLFGEKGISLLAIFALLPLIMRLRKTPKLDERELQLFYKIGNITLGITILLLVAIDLLSDTVIYGMKVGDFWMELSVSAILFFQGLVGLIIFKLQ